MRAPLMLAMVALSSCTSPGGPYPSLQPRAAEAIDPRVPVPDPPVATTPNAALVDQLNGYVGEAQSGDRDFQPLAERARELAGSAGPRESESWIAAQQALSAAIAARAPVAHAVGAIDALGGQRIQAAGGIGPANLAAIDAAAAKVGEIDHRETALIDQIQARLAR